MAIRRLPALLLISVVILAGCRGKEKEKEPPPPPPKPEPLIISVKDTVEWDSIMTLSKPRMVAFVSDKFSGTERLAFYNSFQSVARDYHGKIIFIFVNCDHDGLWKVYDRLNPFNLRQIPLVVSINADGSPVEAYANPPEDVMRSMASRFVSPQ